jgi:SAM-dependent methyltransferase
MRLQHISRQFKAAPWIVRSFLTDLRYGGILTGSVNTQHRHLGAYNVVNSAYSVLPHIFAGRIGPRDVLVDVGCGKGRVINWWLSQGLRNRIVGIEINPAVAAATAKRLRRYPNVTIVAGDATTAIPPDATLLYMYSPFDRPAMERFKAMLVARFARGGITLLYWNADHVDVFRDDPDWNVEIIPLDEIEDPRIGGAHAQYAAVSLPGRSKRFGREADRETGRWSDEVRARPWGPHRGG